MLQSNGPSARGKYNYPGMKKTGCKLSFRGYLKEDEVLTFLI
jgi:hypothetical protein